MTIIEDTSHMDLDGKIGVVAYWLDGDMPGWANTLVKEYGNDLAAMSVSSPWSCVLSAIYGTYSRGWHRMEDALGNAYDDAIACDSWEDDEWRAAWLKAVTKRL